MKWIEEQFLSSNGNFEDMGRNPFAWLYTVIKDTPKGDTLRICTHTLNDFVV